MSFQILKLISDYNIDSTTTGSKSTEGWVNIKCPFCNDHSYKLGIHITGGACNCWGCGSHALLDTIKKLLNLSTQDARQIKKEYSGKEKRTAREEAKAKIKSEVCKLPIGCGKLTTKHKMYLRERGFDANELVNVWGLLGTGIVGDYKHRIIAPIYYNGVIVSWQGRDITGKAEKKWKACRSIDEILDHQKIVDGLDHCSGDACVVVEGRADMWRLGKGAVCVFGISVTTSQVNLLAKRFKKCYIMFDGEELAIKRAEKLGALLSARNVEVEILVLDKGDPGEMRQEDADELMQSLGFKN